MAGERQKSTFVVILATWKSALFACINMRSSLSRCYDTRHLQITGGVPAEQGQAKLVIMGDHLMSRLECVPCRAVYVLPFVDRSLCLPFLPLIKVSSLPVTDILFAKSI